MIPFETERLLLTEATAAEAPFFYKLLNSPGWLEHIGDRKIHTEADAAGYVENGLQKSYREHGYGLYLMKRKSDGQALGICGLVKRAGLDFPDLGFAILPEYESQGYTTEASRATLQLCREHWNIPVVLGITAQANERSQQLLERLGLRRLGLVRLGKDDSELLFLYSIQF